MERQRETLGSRLGFILLSAGCAIGLGNVWRFPFITGKYGGAAFVLVYLVFLALFGLPIMVMEFAIGRAARRNIAGALRALEPAGTRWHLYGPVAIAGNYLLMMFYTVVAGWLLSYCAQAAAGGLVGLDGAGAGEHFERMLAEPWSMAFWMLVVVSLSFAICGAGLRGGVERATKLMMGALFGLMLALAVRAMLLPGAREGLAFYLLPDFGRMCEAGLTEVVFAAMGQAFFTLSLGIGSMAVFGSYIGRERSLTGETVNIVLLDTCVAVASGLIIFPACFAFDVRPDAGPGLLFITLPAIFNQMAGGRVWGALFFAFMSFAALSTVVAVFENIVSYWIDVRGWSRRKAVRVNLVAIPLLALPCVLGFNVWRGFQPLGPGTNMLDLEDFVVSSTLLPLGSLVMLGFCCWRRGWGWNRFLEEANAGRGLKFPAWARVYATYVLPAIVVAVFVYGYVGVFKKLIG